MRILANYGVKHGSENYQVTFETTGDVPKEQADSVCDGLFIMAKSAIERQVNGTANHDAPHNTGVVIPEVKKLDSGNGNGGNGHGGNGKPANGNGGNGNGKPHSKEQGTPISPKQKSLIIKLSKQRRRVIDGLNEMSMSSASKVIEELLAVVA